MVRSRPGRLPRSGCRSYASRTQLCHNPLQRWQIDQLGRQGRGRPSGFRLYSERLPALRLLALAAVATTLAALVGLTVLHSASSCSTRLAVPGHVTDNTTNGRAFEAPLGLCRSAAHESADV